MTTVTVKKLLSDRLPFSGTPYGNAVHVLASLVTSAAGVMTNSDQTTALVQTNKVRFGVLDRGMRIEDGLAIVSDAFTAAMTGKIGFEYVDGVDDADVPQDDDYFFAALALDAAGRTKANNTGVRPVTLPKDAYLILTVGGADAAAVGKLDMLVTGSMVGAN
jgi:hypothetical protein